MQNFSRKVRAPMNKHSFQPERIRMHRTRPHGHGRNALDALAFTKH
jgi:hypothetical protein